MNKSEAELIEKLEELSNDSEVDMYSVATLNAYFEECANMIRGLLEEIQAYRAIGTVEECRAAMEKQSAKTLTFYGDSEDGKLLCPACKEDLWEIKECGFSNCPYCGQKLNWG